MVCSLSCSMLAAAALPGVPRDSNNNNTGGYDATRVEARIVVPLKENAEAVHFIRDNNDPRVITKTYLVRHVDAYNFRDYIRYRALNFSAIAFATAQVVLF